MSLQYANKKVNDLKDKVYLAVKLWGDAEELALLDKEKNDKSIKEVTKKKGIEKLIEESGAFFAFNRDQLLQGIENAIKAGHLQADEKVIHFGKGLYVPPMHKELFLKYFK